MPLRGAIGVKALMEAVAVRKYQFLTGVVVGPSRIWQNGYMSGSRLRLFLLIFRLFDGFACLSVCEQDYMKMSQSVFMKPCRIMDYCYGKNSLNFGIDPTHSGGNIIFIYILLLRIE